MEIKSKRELKFKGAFVRRMSEKYEIPAIVEACLREYSFAVEAYTKELEERAEAAEAQLNQLGLLVKQHA